MSAVILDTHALVWMLVDSPKLSSMAMLLVFVRLDVIF